METELRKLAGQVEFARIRALFQALIGKVEMLDKHLCQLEERVVSRLVLDQPKERVGTRHDLAADYDPNEHSPSDSEPSQAKLDEASAPFLEELEAPEEDLESQDD